MLGAEAGTAGNHTVIDNRIMGYIHAGFNLIEFWPGDEMRLGSVNMRPEWAKEADRLGLPLMYPLNTFAAAETGTETRSTQSRL